MSSRLAAVFVLAVAPLAFADETKQPNSEPKSEEVKAPAKPAFEITQSEKEVIDLTNAERAKFGLPALKMSPALMSAARTHAHGMARFNMLSHNLNGGVLNRCRAAGYRSGFVGENIGWNYRSSRGAVLGWLRSPGHRQNMLRGDYTEIGVAVARNANGEPYWVQVFGRP